MRKSRAASTAACLTLAFGALTGSALAGNGNGNGNGNDGSPPGNSADAPGHVQESAPAPAPAPALAAQPQQPTPAHVAPGQAKKAAPASPKPAPAAEPQQPTPAHVAPGQAKKVAPASPKRVHAASVPGVKPRAATHEHLVRTADSRETKKHGDGAAAGSIATSHGASASTKLYVRANSRPQTAPQIAPAAVLPAATLRAQPHVAVHAQPTHPTRPSVAVVAAAAQVPASVSGTAATTHRVAAAKAKPAARGGVLGIQATIPPREAHPQQGGVLGATRLVARDLPFTGAALTVFVIAAGAIFLAGLTLRRAGRGVL